jgi:ATP-dependent Lhr-like helicase
VWFDRRSHHLVTFPEAAVDASWADALVALVKDDRLRSVEVRKVDGEQLADVPAELLRSLRDAGFVDGYRGLTYRS